MFCLQQLLTLSMVMQTIALASTQVFQPIWSRATTQSLALASHKNADLVDHAMPPSMVPSSVASVAAPAQTPKKELLLRAASPLLEEMLESPVTASKPTQGAATGSPGRHALYQDVLHSSNSSHRQGLLSPLPCVMSSNGGVDVAYTRGLPALGSAAGTDECRQDLPLTLDMQAASPCSISGEATIAAGMTAAAIMADTCMGLSLPSPDARPQADAAAVSSKSASHGHAAVDVRCDGAVAEAAPRCCSDATACASSASINHDCLPSHAQARTGNEMAAHSSGACLEPVAEDTAERDIAKQQPGKPVSAATPADILPWPTANCLCLCNIKNVPLACLVTEKEQVYSWYYTVCCMTVMLYTLPWLMLFVQLRQWG